MHYKKGKHIANILRIIMCFFILSACGKEEIKIQQNFEYDIRVQKYRTDVSIGKPIEFVFFIENTGNYSDVTYSVNYFIRKGGGTLYWDNRPITENVNYSLSGRTLKILYIPTRQGGHTIEVDFSDNFNLHKEISIELTAQ